MEWATADNIAERRRALRLELDTEPNFDKANVSGKQRFVTVRF